MMDVRTTRTYPLFADADVELIELTADDTLFDTGEFLSLCIQGSIMDYDGFGQFVVCLSDKYYAIKDMSFSIDNDIVYYKGEDIGGIFYFCNVFSIHHIVWYNK